MKGKIIKFIEHLTKWNKAEYSAIIIDHRNGYNVRKSWSDKSKFIERTLVKVHWLREPSIKPASALRRMSLDWNMDPQYSFGFAVTESVDAALL